MSSPWNVGVYVNLAPRSVRDVSTSTSSFYFYGVVALAWRDDSLCHGPFPPGYLEGTFPYGLGRPYVDGDTYVLGDTDRVSNYSWTRGVGAPGPGVQFVQSSVVSPSAQPLTFFFVSTRAPPFVDDRDGSCFVVGGGPVSGTFGFEQDLDNFPFDTQTFSMSLVNQMHDAADMNFVVPSSWSDQIAGTTIQVAGFDDVSARMSTSTTSASLGSRPVATIEFVGKRDWRYWLLKIVLPISINVVSNLFCHMLPIVGYARIDPLDTTIFNLALFEFIYWQLLPGQQRQGRIESFFTFCNAFTFTNFVVVVWLYGRRCRLARVLCALGFPEPGDGIVFDLCLTFATTLLFVVISCCIFA